MILLLVVGLLILALVFRLLGTAQRDRTKSLWSRLLLQICGVKVHLSFPQGQSRVPDTALIALNHVSWLDIFVLNTVVPATFVAKSEIRSWPVVGWLVAGAGTIFIERGSRHAVRRVNHEIRRRLERNEHVAFFPEGSTSNGFDLLPFHASLFAAALTDDPTNEDQLSQLILPVQPAVLRYFQDGLQSDRCAYIDHQTLVHSVMRIVSARGLSVELEFLPVITSLPPPMTRHAVAAKAEEQIRYAVRSRQG